MQLIELLKQLENDDEFPESSNFLTDGTEDELPPRVEAIVQAAWSHISPRDMVTLVCAQELRDAGFAVNKHSECSVIVTTKGRIALGG